jgi:AcrR family transcriptional regulator
MKPKAKISPAQNKPTKAYRDVIWMRAEQSNRGPKPAHDRRCVALASIKIADAEGIDLVSIRRVAAVLGIGAASLYRYFLTKDELFDLMIDVVMGEEEPPELTGKWRKDLEEIAYRTRSILKRHSWMIPLLTYRTTLGPNNLRWWEHILGALVATTLDMDDIVIMTNTLMIFTRGYVMLELAEEEASRRSGLSRKQWMEQQGPYGAVIEESGSYPIFTRLLREAKVPHAPDLVERGFELALACVLDGFATRIEPTKNRNTALVTKTKHGKGA